MTQLDAAAMALTALELLPGEPSDLAKIFASPEQRSDLFSLATDLPAETLVGYLCREIDYGRVERWHKVLESVVRERAGRPVLVGEADYPALLNACWDRPPVLFVRGHLPLAAEYSLAIVGSRNASESVLQDARETAMVCSQFGFSIISGLAKGVDTAAHRGALAANGHTVAVLGTGIRRTFPEENADLAQEIVSSKGGLISQFPPDAPKSSTTFLRRNNVIAGMSSISLVMAGDERSGSRHQAEQAIRYDRPVLLWGPELSTRQWAVELARGGGAFFVDSAHAVLDFVRQKVGSPSIR